MTAETYESIKTEWQKITNKEQRLLIYSYIKKRGSCKHDSWMEFLRNHFGVAPEPQPQLPLQSSLQNPIT